MLANVEKLHHPFDPPAILIPHRYGSGLYPQAGSWKRAMMLLAEMYVQGMRPAGFAVAATIRACSSVGEWRKGLEVLRQSQQVKPSKPDPCSLSAAIEMCCRAGELVSAVGFLACTKKREAARQRTDIGKQGELSRGLRAPVFCRIFHVFSIVFDGWLAFAHFLCVPGARTKHTAPANGTGRK